MTRRKSPTVTLAGIAFVAAGVLGAQLAGALVGRRRGLGLHAQPAKRRGKGFRAAFAHGGDVDRLPAQGMVGAYLAAAMAVAEEGHRKNPLLSRYASQRVMKPASLAWPSN